MRLRGWAFRFGALIALGLLASLAGGPFAGGQTTGTELPIGEPTSGVVRANRFPGAGTDAFESIASFVVFAPNEGQCDPVPPPTSEIIDAAGPTIVNRSGVGDADGDKHKDIQTEITSMELTGFHPLLGDFSVTENRNLVSAGVVESQGPGKSPPFPAESFFDVFVEIQTHEGTLHNEQPIRVQALVTGLPPIGSEYKGQNVVRLLDQQSQPVFCIGHAAHAPEEPSHVLIKKELIRIEKKLDLLLQQQR